MTSDAERPSAAGRPDFSLVRGGPVYRLGQRLGRGRGHAQLRLGILIVLATWMPLLVLTAMEGVLLGGGANVSFAASLATHARFLAAIPLLFGAEAWIDPHLGSFVHQVAASRLVPPAKLADLHRAIRSAVRWRDSVIVEASLLALALVLVVADVRWWELSPHVSTWRTATSPTGPHLTAAGWWYTVFALPVFQFVVGRWYWRILIWWVFLWRLCRLRLDLIPTHPDLAGGLAGLGIAQSFFGALSFASSTVLTATFAEEILFAGVHLGAFTWHAVGIVAINLAVFVGPLVMFTPQLLATKLTGLHQYDSLATRYRLAFDAKWLRSGGPVDEPLPDLADIRAIAQLAQGAQIIRAMRIVPFGRPLLVGIAAAALAPMLPLLLTAFSLEHLLHGAIKRLLGL